VRITDSSRISRHVCNALEGWVGRPREGRFLALFGQVVTGGEKPKAILCASSEEACGHVNRTKKTG
jgi:hypothetical protein